MRRVGEVGDTAGGRRGTEVEDRLARPPVGDPFQKVAVLLAPVIAGGIGRVTLMSLLVVHVDVAVVPDQVEAFHAATEANAAASRTEPGVVRFDVLTDRSDPTHIVLVEVYRDGDAAAAHKETLHYATWRDTVAPMMARPRSSVKYANVSPDDAAWG